MARQKNAIPDCLFFLSAETEEGSFESLPLSLNLEKDETCEDRDFNNIVSEYFDELENPPKWILLGAPTTLFLFERNKWSRGQFLKFSWDEIFQQKSDDLFTSIIGLVSKDSLCPDSGSSLHDEIDDNSVTMYDECMAIDVDKTGNAGELRMMWEDLQLRRRTEIDHLQGAIVRLAAQHGGRAPLSERIVELVRSAETAKQGPPGLQPAQIASN